jgi:DNA (cytosine-5)-methyltransferase 1
VTAVEIEPSIADFYQKEFPKDEVVVGDAHEYLKENHDEDWDFVWSSPPCQTHSQMHKMGAVSDHKELAVREPDYPDMELYQEVIFCQHFVECDWVVENVDPYYEPLIEPQQAGRHSFWSNFYISDFETPPLGKTEAGETQRLEKEYGYDLSSYEFNVRKDQVISNCVHPKLGKHVLEAATKNRQATLDY